MTMLHRLAGALHVDVTACATLLETLFTLCKCLTGATDDVIMTWLAQRLDCVVTDPKCAQALLEIDELRICLQKDEEQDIRKQRDRNVEFLQTQMQMQSEYRARRKEIDGRPHKRPKVVKRPLLADVAQRPTREIKRLFPPKAIPWKNRSDGTWHC